MPGPISGTTLISFVHTQGVTGSDSVCTLGVFNEVTTQAQINDIASAWATTVMDNVANTTTFLRAVGLDGDGVSTISNITPVVGGDSEGDPAMVAGVVRKNTGLGGASMRGRLFLPGVPQEYTNANGTIDNAWVVAQQTNMNAFWTAIDALDFSPCLFHGPGPLVNTANAILSFTVLPTLGTQRRRMR